MTSSTDASPPSSKDKAALLELLEERRRRSERAKLTGYQGTGGYRPYPRQKEFHDAGATYRERLFMAGNRLGKTMSAAAEVAMHLTGRYPAWWRGKRWNRPVRAWAAGETAETTRDAVQRMLIGPPVARDEWGTGFIPGDAIGRATLQNGTADAIDTVLVKHDSGGWSELAFRSYGRGRERWQAVDLDLLWFDEEPPADVYHEGRTRTGSRQGLVMVTFTPLLGMSEVVRMFLEAQASGSTTRIVIRMTINEVSHFTDEQRRIEIEAYADHERQARAFAEPVLGSGRVFAIDEAEIVERPFELPDYWPEIGGIDFGIEHPTAAVKLAWDRDTDCVHLVAEYRVKGQIPVIHAAALKPWGSGLPWAWPHDGAKRDLGGGTQIATQYRDAGLFLLREHATFDDGTMNVEQGVSHMLTRMRTGRWKVFDTCRMWLEEVRLYHRENGIIEARFDDLISASRYAMMMLRRAQVPSQYRARGKRQSWWPQPEPYDELRV